MFALAELVHPLFDGGIQVVQDPLPLGVKFVDLPQQAPSLFLEVGHRLVELPRPFASFAAMGFPFFGFTSFLSEPFASFGFIDVPFFPLAILGERGRQKSGRGEETGRAGEDEDNGGDDRDAAGAMLEAFVERDAAQMHCGLSCSV
ncbi:MAG: hypothetical protein DWQ34_06885 [Planctomycetota bacterium]|nr:MAG: hypothetical protein DWQ34_06885 [Planctomycetota bacterium]REK26565.1 MAG: hypothetical protein DWQ41_09910 [Planctomycetota bacterium]REK34052.1 MAG: hypothetical protein DWQ45_13875 [Planctomycetota bacterium]